jgi:phage shock protein E
MIKKILNLLFGSADDSQLKSILAEKPFLVDVRSTEEFKSGSAKGAVNIPLSDIFKAIKKFEHQKHIVVFCRSGNRSAQAKTILNNQGFNNVINGGTFQNVNQLIKTITN